MEDTAIILQAAVTTLQKGVLLDATVAVFQVQYVAKVEHDPREKYATDKLKLMQTDKLRSLLHYLPEYCNDFCLQHNRKDMRVE